MVYSIGGVSKALEKAEIILANKDAEAEIILANKDAEANQAVVISDNQISLYSPDKSIKTYVPSPTALKFHSSNALVRLVIGPYGSGKSTMCCIEIIKRACEMPPCLDGIRRCRVICVRNTYSDLKLTTLDIWNEWARNKLPCTVSHDKPLERTYRFSDGMGIIELHLIFLPLDRMEDIGHLKSMPATFVYANELSELVKFVFDNFTGRTGRYPSQNDCPHDFWNGIIADTNPPDNDHWIPELFERAKPKDFEIYHQPPAMIKDESGIWVLNPEAENITHLPPRYYDKLIAGKNEEFIRVFACGEYGSATDGKLVFPNYNDDLHGVDHIEPRIDAETVIGIDYGVQASAFIIAQIHDQQLCIVKEFISQQEGIEAYAKNEVIPWLQRNIDMERLSSQGDPSGVARQVTDLSSPQIVLNALGFKIEPANTNDPGIRIEGVNYFLDRLLSGKPAIKVSRRDCPILRAGFLKKYIFRRTKELNKDACRDKPDKTHPHSDAMDALQYICLKYAMITRKKVSDSKNKPGFMINASE